MKVVLELQGQRSNIKRVTVRHDIVIGRATECNLRVSSPQVSRRHCFLRVSSSGVSITDLESANGTWLNGEKIVAGKRYPIEDGTDLNVGPVRFVARVSHDVPAVNLNSGLDLGAAQAFETSIPPDLANSASMDFSIEHAGPSAEADEPTVDYGSGYKPSTGLSGDDIASEEFADVMEIEVLDSADDSDQIVEAIVIASDEATEFAVVDDVQVIDEVIECDDVEIIDDIEVVEECEPALNFAGLEAGESRRLTRMDRADDSGASWFPSENDVEEPVDEELQKFLKGQ